MLRRAVIWGPIGRAGDYDHVATVQERRVSLSWVGSEISGYEALASAAEADGVELEDYIKRKLGETPAEA